MGIKLWQIAGTQIMDNLFKKGHIADIFRMVIRIDVLNEAASPMKYEIDSRTVEPCDLDKVIDKLEREYGYYGGNIPWGNCEQVLDPTVLARKRQLLKGDVEVTVALANYDHVWIRLSASLRDKTSWKFLVRNMFSQMMQSLEK